MSEKDDPQKEQAPHGPRGAGSQRPSRSGEGIESVLNHLREQESQRAQDDPTGGGSAGN